MGFDTRIEGQATLIELMQMELWASTVSPNGSIVEIGSFKGRSTVAWASSCDPSVTVYSFFYSSNADIYKNFINNTQHFKNVMIHQDSTSFEEIDICFLYSSFEFSMDQLMLDLCLPKIKKGGMICGHGYGKHDAVKDIVQYVEDKIKQKVFLYPPHSSLWSFRIE